MERKKMRPAIVTGIVFLFAVASGAVADVQYNVYDIGDFVPRFINNNGTIAGDTRVTVNGSSQTVPYIYKNGIGTAFMNLPGGTTISSLNNSDVAIVAGMGTIENMVFQQMAGNYAPYAINDKGQTLAWNHTDRNLYILGSTNKLIPNSWGLAGWAINNNGDALLTEGVYAQNRLRGTTVLWHDSVLNTVNAGVYSMNDSCHYVGYYLTSINSISANAFFLMANQ
jgi:hypothetical protein